MKSQKAIFNIFSKKTAALLIISAMAFAAFASLGDGNSKGSRASLVNRKSSVTPGKFSLKSGYQYRGSQVINQSSAGNTITLNSLVTYQKGNITYVLPMKTKVNTQKIKVSVGIPQMVKH
jgi:hypothetical protein